MTAGTEVKNSSAKRRGISSLFFLSVRVNSFYAYTWSRTQRRHGMLCSNILERVIHGERISGNSASVSIVAFKQKIEKMCMCINSQTSPSVRLGCMFTVFTNRVQTDIVTH